MSFLTVGSRVMLIYVVFCCVRKRSTEKTLLQPHLYILIKVMGANVSVALTQNSQQGSSVAVKAMPNDEHLVPYVNFQVMGANILLLNIRNWGHQWL